MKTTAALLVEPGKPLELAELEIPALKPGQVLVEIAYSAASATRSSWKWRGDIAATTSCCRTASATKATGTVLRGRARRRPR